MKLLGLNEDEYRVRAGLGEVHGPWKEEHIALSYPYAWAGQPVDLSYLLQKPADPGAEDECVTFLKGFSLYFEQEVSYDYMLDFENDDYVTPQDVWYIDEMGKDNSVVLYQNSTLILPSLFHHS